MTLATFRSTAEQLGAVVVVAPAPTPSPLVQSGRWVRSSVPDGGCGWGGCRCSPGLWVSMGDGKRVAVAHFGTHWERGGEGVFTGADQKAWLVLVARAGAEL